MSGAPRLHIRSLTVLIYINDLQWAIKCCKAHCFADDTNLMNFRTLVITINKQINHNLKNLSNLNANKISLNASKTELVMFNSNKNHLDHELTLNKAK